MSKVFHAGLFVVALGLLTLAGACSTPTGTGGEGTGAGGGAASPAAQGDDTAHARALFRQHRRWSKSNAPSKVSPQHMGYTVDQYTKGASGRGAYTPGAALALAGRKQGRSVVWLMEKRARGYDPAHGDWWYATVTGRGGRVAMAGKLAMCINCHSRARRDHVFLSGE